jgi:hypothetical protein
MDRLTDGNAHHASHFSAGKLHHEACHTWVSNLAVPST